MSIGKRVYEAVEKLCAGDGEAALIPTSIALDTTAKTLYSEPEVGKRIKTFIDDNFVLITKVATEGEGVMASLKLPYKHPKITPDQNGLCGLHEILYHVARCGLLHDSCLPSDLLFTPEMSGIRVVVRGDGRLELSSSIVRGLLMAVIACPANANEKLSNECTFTARGKSYPLSQFWGTKADLEALYFAGS